MRLRKYGKIRKQALYQGKRFEFDAGSAIALHGVGQRSSDGGIVRI
jgi:hypothetical protein